MNTPPLLPLHTLLSRSEWVFVIAMLAIRVAHSHTLTIPISPSLSFCSLHAKWAIVTLPPSTWNLLSLVSNLGAELEGKKVQCSPMAQERSLPHSL